MLCPTGAGKQVAKRRRSEDTAEDSEPTAIRQRTYDHISTSEHARAQFGDQYYQTFNGPVQQGASLAPERKVIDALRFDGIELRQNSIKLAYGNTCQWFFDSTEFKTWRADSSLEEHHGFMWIRGKPGAGKSTLMKLAVKDAGSRFPDDLQVSFFFNAKGTALEKSVEGMYRTLLCQLLSQCPKLEKAFHGRAWAQSNWPVELLEEYFRDCVLQLGSMKLTCHVDALDECEEADIRGMVDFFDDLGSTAIAANVRVHVCFASRHYPHISMTRCIHMILDNLSGHQADVETYVQNNLKVEGSKIRDELAEEIRKKSGGVFLWVVLAVRVLNRESDRGYSHSLRGHLDAIPAGLYDVFENAITGRGTSDRHYLLPTLLCILFSWYPLTPLALYQALLCTEAKMIDTTVAENNISSSHVEKFILNTSKGLAEISRPLDNPAACRVQFIHETVREFLQTSGLGRLQGSMCSNPIGISHDHLRARCSAYLSFVARNIDQSEGLLDYPAGSAPLSKDRRERFYNIFPFLKNAFVGVMAHAALAQAHGISQLSFLETFPVDLVVYFNNLLAEDGDGMVDPRSASKVYIFAGLHAPMAPLLSLELSGVGASADHLAYKEAAHGTSQGFWGHPLHMAVARDNFDVVKILLEHGFDVNARAGPYDTALLTAINATTTKGHKIRMISLLLEYGADVNAETSMPFGPTALLAAVKSMSLNVVILLVVYGADVNAKAGGFGAALHYARTPRHGRGVIVYPSIVKYLIKQGADCYHCYQKAADEGVEAQGVKCVYCAET